MTNKPEFLGSLSIFANLNEAELTALSRISHEYSFLKGATIAFQGDVADSMYIVRSGRLYAKVIDNRGAVRESPFTRGYKSGEWFGESWLFTPGAYPATVKAMEDGRLIIIKSQDFLTFLTQNRAALDKLEPELDEENQPIQGLSVEAWAEAQKMAIKERKRRASDLTLLPDELVEYFSRRSRWYLFLRVFWPVFFILFLPLLFVLLPAEPFYLNIARYAALIIGEIVAVGLLLFRYIDWRNDYFVITNQHLTHHEFELRSFVTRLVMVPIEQVQSVTIDKPTLISNLFNIGTARVTTASQAGTVLFDNIDDPRQVKLTLNRLIGRVQALDAGITQTAMRRSLAGHFQLPPAYEPVQDEEEAAAAPPPAAKQRRSPNWRSRLGWRVEENDVVTYRKHIFVLIKRLLPPGALMLLIFALSIGILVTFGLQWLPWVALIATIVGLVVLGWLVWRFEDWRNDTFQVTNRFVMDIDRKPFGFGESRKQAALSNIQNVSAERPGFLPTLFDYGYVLIETAGATADIRFESVPHPSHIQADIFKRLDEYRRQQRVREGAARRQEYAVLVDVYRQIMEQSPIPPRTPVAEETAPDSAAAPTTTS